MLQFFRRRIVKDRKSRSQPSSLIGPLENADITPDGSYLYLSRRSGQLVWKMDLSSNQVFGVVVSDPNLMVAADVAMGTAGVGVIVSFEPQPGNTNTIRQISIPNGPVADLVGANGPVT